jgi:hypothetical protein
MEFVTALVNECVASGIGTLYGKTGVSIQDGFRRDFSPSPETVVLFRGGGGEGLPFDTSEEYAIQVLVDSATVSGARAVARQVYNQLHDRRAENIGGFGVLWLRGVAPPQDLGPGPADRERFTVTANFTARLLR